MAKRIVKPRAPSPPRSAKPGSRKEIAPSETVAAICGAAAFTLQDWIDRRIVPPDAAIATPNDIGWWIGPGWIKGICFPDSPIREGPTVAHLRKALAWVGAGCPEVLPSKPTVRPRASRPAPRTGPRPPRETQPS